MHAKKRLLSIAAVTALAASLFWGGILQAETGGEISAGERGRLFPWSSEKETIYFWYSDETMTNFLNSAAVSFGEQEEVRVIPESVV